MPAPPPAAAAARAIDEHLGDLVGRLTRKLGPQRGRIAHPEPRRHRDHLIGQPAGSVARATLYGPRPAAGRAGA